MLKQSVFGLLGLALLANVPTNAQTSPSVPPPVVIDQLTPDGEGDPNPSLVPTPKLNDWDETATNGYYNSVLRLSWSHYFGDHGNQVLAAANIAGASTAPVNIPVSGNNFFISCGPGTTVFGSRENPDATTHPTLTVNGSQVFQATRDTYLDPSTSQALGSSNLLSCRKTVLVAFDTYIPQPGDHAVLQLTPIRWRSNQVLTVYAPQIPTSRVEIQSSPATRVIANIMPSNFKDRSNLARGVSAITGSSVDRKLAYVSQIFKVPPAQEYYLTVIMRIDGDWPNWGGKFPGLANTGQGTNTAGTSLIVGGINCDNAGWGGRVANGCRWSARTGWGHRQADKVSAGTYYYALHPSSHWGDSFTMNDPWPIGKWFAYVERVKMNDVGQSNGVLSYWRCSDTVCSAQFNKNDIAWRNTDIQQSQISEIWANIYCGGTTCPRDPAAVSSASIRRLTVTDGLPDLTALAAEVRVLNAS